MKNKPGSRNEFNWVFSLKEIKDEQLSYSEDEVAKNYMF